MGWPISHSRSPVIHGHWIKQLGLRGAYVPLAVNPVALPQALSGLSALGFAGCNLTLPHKVDALACVHQLDDVARQIGAVNTVVVNPDGSLRGTNTDAFGYIQSLHEAQPSWQARQGAAVVLGAGGAARAIGVELALAGASHITLVNRSAERGQALATLLRDKAKIACDLVIGSADAKIPEGTDVVINATSIGLYPDVNARLPLDTSGLKASMVVADVIPNPPTTRLVREAREKGCKVIDGLGMLVNQGVIGIKHWSGIDPDPAIMRKALEDVFGV